MTNPANNTQWSSATESAEWTTDGPPAVGSTIKVVLNLGWRRVEDELEVTEWEPFNIYSIKGSDGNLSAATTTRFEPRGNGTQLTFNARIKGAGFLKPAGGVDRQTGGKAG